MSLCKKIRLKYPAHRHKFGWENVFISDDGFFIENFFFIPSQNFYLQPKFTFLSKIDFETRFGISPWEPQSYRLTFSMANFCIVLSKKKRWAFQTNMYHASYHTISCLSIFFSSQSPVICSIFCFFPRWHCCSFSLFLRWEEDSSIWISHKLP